MKELDFIQWLRRQDECDRADVPVGPGDDCAVVNQAGEAMLITTDQLLDGVHFDLQQAGPTRIGRKSMARNLSDIAAMAGIPTFAVGTIALPRGFDQRAAESMYRGRRELSDAYDCPMVGGDVGSWDGPLAISITLMGKPGPWGPVLRSGARPGDVLCVTGQLGGAWRTDRHLEFWPRISEAQALAAEYDIHAMIDLSDGLSTDLNHLAAASGVGARIDSSALPIHRDADLAKDPLAAAISDGEDYELLFALPPDQARRLAAAQPLRNLPVARIGECTDDGRVVMLVEGTPRDLPRGGWEQRT